MSAEGRFGNNISAAFRHNGSERAPFTVAQLIGELGRCDPEARVAIWNEDEGRWLNAIFIDEYGIRGADAGSAFGPRVRLGSHVYDNSKRQRMGACGPAKV